VAKISNETKLIIALLKEKAKAQKEFSARNAKVLKEEQQQVYYEKGMNWVLETLDNIVTGIAKP